MRSRQTMSDKGRTRSILLYLALTVSACAQTSSNALPRFEDYPAGVVFTGGLIAPRLVTPLEKAFASQIRDGLEKGYGVFRDGKEQKGPNFAGNLVVIQWGCGVPCLRMAVVDARTGDVYSPPISFEEDGTRSFDLPLFSGGNSVSRNPEIQFSLNSKLMIVKASPRQSRPPTSYTYYFLWEDNRWVLLRKMQLEDQRG